MNRFNLKFHTFVLTYLLLFYVSNYILNINYSRLYSFDQFTQVKYMRITYLNIILFGGQCSGPKSFGDLYYILSFQELVLLWMPFSMGLLKVSQPTFSPTSTQTTTLA